MSTSQPLTNAPHLEHISQAGQIIVSGDPQLWGIIKLSLGVSASALVIALALGIPLALAMAIYRFPGHRVLHMIIDTLMALPPVVVGLVVYLLLSQAGPLGIWGLLYTPTAMIMAQSLLLSPIVIALSLQLFQGHWLRIKDQLMLLGYRRRHCFGLLFNEAKGGLLTVALAAFGRGLGEIGAVMIVGGNIEQQTRVITTAIAMETRQGNLALALALGLVLMFMALVISALAHLSTGKGNDHKDRNHKDSHHAV